MISEQFGRKITSLAAALTVGAGTWFAAGVSDAGATAVTFLDPTAAPNTGVKFFGALGNAGLGNVDGYFEWFQNGNDGIFATSLTNTSPAAGSRITGFGFFLPSSIALSDLHIGAAATGISLSILYVDTSNTCTKSILDCDNTPVARTTYPLFTLTTDDFVPNEVNIDFGAALGGDITGGGSPAGGIPIGGTGVFEFVLHDNNTGAAPSLLGLNTSSFVPDSGNFWCVRWRGFTDGGSDEQCGQASDTPTAAEPATLTLFGVALLGLGLVRRRQARA